MTTSGPVTMTRCSRFWSSAFAVLALFVAEQDAGEARLRLRRDRTTQLGDHSRGTYRVFENRSSAAGSTLELDILILHATGPEPAKEPIYVLAGGPGQAAVSIAPTNLGVWARKTHDLVFVNQRGAGGTSRLGCTLTGTDGDALPSACCSA